MSRIRYRQVYDNESETLDPAKWFLRLQCCDCMLVHDVRFDIVGNKVSFEFKVNDKETQRVRRAKGEK